MDVKNEKYLLELTALPTATGHEDRVMAWIERWAQRKKNVELTSDRWGNIMLKRVGARSRKPIFFTAHMDHPAFVVTEQIGPRKIKAEFRGGVRDEYFVGSRVCLHLGDIGPCKGKVVNLVQPKPPAVDKQVTIELVRPVVAEPGDVLTWDLPAPKITRGLLKAPACDDLAGVAAAISAFEVLLKSKKRGLDVRVLLTRAEEIGFIGAIGACKSGIIPKGARLIALETSKSFAESPVGGGPIVRVGDKTKSFDPDLTYAVSRVGLDLEQEDKNFKWQRKLMPGGTCEASAYQTYGFTATCLCLALQNYHNMNEGFPPPHGRTKPSVRKAVRIDSEAISVADYHGLVRMLVEVGKRLDDKKTSLSFKARLDPLFARRRSVL